MNGLPVVPGAQLIRALERVGWESVRQRGSHVRLRHPERRTFLVVPLHKELKRGTLRGILRDADLTVGVRGQELALRRPELGLVAVAAEPLRDPVDAINVLDLCREVMHAGGNRAIARGGRAARLSRLHDRNVVLEPSGREQVPHLRCIVEREPVVRPRRRRASGSPLGVNAAKPAVRRIANGRPGTRPPPSA